MTGTLRGHLCTVKGGAVLLSKSGIQVNLGDGLNFSSRSQMRGVQQVTRITGLVGSTNLVIVATFVSPCQRSHRGTGRVVKSNFQRICIDASVRRYRGESMGKLCGTTQRKGVTRFAKVADPCRVPRRTSIIMSATRVSIRAYIGRVLRRLGDLLQRSI